MTQRLEFYQQKVLEAGIDLHTEESLEYLRIRLRKLRRERNPEAYVRKHMDFNVERIYRGNMYSFVYDPKTKEKMDYYDIFPLVIVLKRLPDGFIGLNMHYLSPLDRAVLYYGLLERITDEDYDDKTRLLITYRLLNAIKKKRFAKAIVKRYLYKNIETRTLKIPSDLWEVALMTRTEMFIKESVRIVWRESRKKAILKG